MENTKAKNVLITILVILLIGVIAYVVWMSCENKKEVASLKEQIQKNNNNTAINISEGSKEESKTTETDIYEKYSEIKWSSTAVGEKEGLYVYIENGNVYVDDFDLSTGKYVRKHNQIIGFNDSVKKVEMYSGSGAAIIIILTDSKDVYQLNYSETALDDMLVAKKTHSDIIDMALGKYNEFIKNRGMYYLTNDGKLIDEEGNTVKSIEQ